MAAAPTPPPPGTPAQVGLTSSAVASNNGKVSPQSVPIEASPGGCYGQTDYAHKSGSDSSVHGRTRCAFNVSSLGVTTYLWNLAWFGWNLLNTNSSSRSNASDSQDAHPHYGCSSTDKHQFYGSSTHYSVENGTEYDGSTASPSQSFAC